MEKYPVEDGQIYLKQLQKIRQENYRFIGDYEDTIKECVNKWALCTEAKKDEEIRRIEEVFLTNLNPKVEIEMLKTGHTTAQTISDKIKCIEKILRRQIKEREMSHNTFIQNNTERVKEPLQIPKEKYCSYHKNFSHNTSDCWTKRNKEKHRNQWINARNCFSWKGAECCNQNLIKTIRLNMLQN
ncbi:hypothetical protein M153_1486000982 [Pseudoloma neurophilia]|uniref:Uncharacterized protein n=1 Tax=Pseudoloma neurophilia TaxID=146866 RepID=A0A0R0M114_9MICR|nr:hypothetical protein M153_1486000982 [Pseudoloma neurophilia]